MTPESVQSFPTSAAVTSSYKIHVEGETADKLLRAMFGDAPTGFGEVVLQDGVAIGRITPTRYLLQTDSGDALTQLESAPKDRFITITDQSHGLTSFHFAEENAVEGLSLLCGLDFRPQAFPINCVKISSLAKIRATIWHLEDGWHVWIGRSYTNYLQSII